MKKSISILLVLAMLLSLAGCGGKTEVPSVSLGTETVQEDELARTARYLRESVPEPTYGSVGGEWIALGLARSELPGTEDYLLGYGERVAAYVAQQGGILNPRKYTEYSRVILAWTAIGRDARDVGGFDLLVPLADYEQTTFQGLSGPIFALLALDCGDYAIPENAAPTTQATRELYVDYIVGAQLPEGGWSLAGGPAETDLTAMALQALAKYRERPDVADALEKGLEMLSQMQNANGGFSSGDAETCESVAQVLVALTELKLPLDDTRFVKNGNTLKDALLRFRQSDGSFCHLMEEDGDIIATEQAFYALVACQRQEQGKSPLYQMKEA